MLVHRLLEGAARRTPDAPAIIQGQDTLTYAQLDALVNRFAHLYQRSGVVRGDRVLLAMENSAHSVGAYLGAMKAGATAVPLPAGPRSDRLARAVADCTPRVCVIDAATARHPLHADALRTAAAVYVAGPVAERQGFVSLKDALAAASETFTGVRSIDRDLAAIIYTSGSTGEPRGVMLTHRNLVANARSIVSYLELTARDRVMCVLPFHYVYGLSLLHTHLAVGASIVIDNRFTFPNVVLDAMKAHAVTGFAGVPSTFALLLHRSNLAGTTLPSLRYVTQAGGSMPPARIAEWLERGPKVPFYVMYGATEAGARLTYLPPSALPSKLGSIGKPIPNVEIVILNERGDRAAAGEVGELVARGSNVSCGYWNDEAETRTKFTALGYRTGDLGYVDADGFLFLVGRLHDMLKVGAHRVGAKEIEDVLYEHLLVRDAAVVGMSHDILGEAPVAFVSPSTDGGLDAEHLRAHCAERLASHKVPVRFVFVPDLPKTPVGKIDKVALRAALADDAGPLYADAPAPGLAASVSSKPSV